MILRHYALVLLVMVIWGFNFVVAKLGLEELPPLLMMAIRFGLVALLLVWFVTPPMGYFRQIAALSVTLGSLHFGLIYVGLSKVDAAVASIAVQLQVPFAAMLAAIFFKDRFGWRRSLGLAVAFSGVVVIAWEPRVSADLVHLLLIVAASFVWAAGNVQVKTLRKIDGFTLNAWISLLAAPQLLILSLLLEDGQMAALSAAGWQAAGAILYMTVMVTIIGYGIWYHMIERYPTNQTMPFTLLVPIYGVLGGVFVLGEPLTWRILVGGVATLAGVAIIVLRRPKLAQPEV